MYKAIIFDFFGVIHNDPFRTWLEQNRITDIAPYEEKMKLVDTGDITPAELFVEFNGLSGIPIDVIRRDFDKKHLLDAKILPLIDSLGKSYKVGLLSNAGTEEIRSVIDEHRHDDRFHAIVISAEAGVIKPDKEAFLHVLKQLYVKPQEAVFIDDNQANVDAARKIGITGLKFVNVEQLVGDLKRLGIDF